MGLPSTASSKPHNPKYSGTSCLIELTSSNPNGCQAYCPCQCHLRTSGQTPYWLKGVFGALFYQSTGSPVFSRRPCNFFRCQSRTGSMKFQYHFPTRLLSMIFQMSAAWDDLGGAKASWSFQVPQYIDVSAPGLVDLWQLIQDTDNPQHLAYLMDRYKISARAVNPDGEESLLDVSTHPFL